MSSENDFFKLLATRKRQISQGNTDPKKLKSEILAFIEENQSFEGILSEVSDSKEQKHVQSDLGSIDISGEFVVSDCISLLKHQAKKASCTLDLLAAELLSKKLYQAICNCSDGNSQFLNDKQKAVMSTVVMIIKALLKENSFNRVHFAKCLSSGQQHQVSSLPLEVLWILHTSHITSFNTYLACCSYNTVSCGSLVKGLVETCNSSPPERHSDQVAMISVFVSVLLPLAYKEKPNNDKKTNLEKVSEDILQNMINNNMLEFSSSEDESSVEYSRIDILEVIRHIQDIPEGTMSKFFTDRLHKLLFSSSKNSQVSDAVMNQGKWNFSSLTEQTRTRFQQFLYIFDPKSIMDHLSQAFTRKEVDWRTILSFLSVFLVCQEEAAALIKEYTDSLLQDAMTTCDIHSMAVLLLVIRQSSLEGTHVFPSYLTWFKSKFGNAATTLLNNKKTVQFFMQFLSELVPYEPSYYLKVHIIKSPQVPAKLRSFIHDYVSLARTRLMDLKEPVELTGLYDHESSILLPSDEKTEHQKLQEQAISEVEKVLDSYGKTGKVPGSVMEASIFRKPYFIGRFLPALLTPRKLPDRPDTRCKLIDTLSKAGKISSGMLDAYCKACEKMAFDCDETSAEDDCGLSDLEKLKKNLKSLSKDIIQSFENNNKTSKTGIPAKISLLAGHIKSMVKTDNNVTFPSPVVIDLTSPCLDAKAIQIVDSLLNAFCRVCIATRTAINSNDHSKFKWLSEFVAMVMSIPAIHMPLYYRLWELLCSKGALSLTISHIQGLASFLCHVNSHHMTPVLLLNVGNVMYKEKQEKIFSFVENIFHLILIATSEWMEFYVRICCAYLQHAAESFSDVEILPPQGKPGDLKRNKCFVPQMLMKKLWYLIHRFSFHAFYKQDCRFNHKNIVDTINTVKTTALYQRLIAAAPKVSFDEWLTWEMSIERDEDLFNDTDRVQYHDAAVLGHFLPMDLQDGGCGNSYKTACTKMMDKILDRKHRTCVDNECPHTSNSGQKENTKKSGFGVDLVNLLERTIQLMANKSKDKSSHNTKQSWLLFQYHRRLATLEKDKDPVTVTTPENILIEHETKIFTELIIQLPVHLVFSDHGEKMLTGSDISAIASFVNSSLRVYTGISCCLPLNITSHLIKGFLTLSRVKDAKDDSYLRSNTTESLIKKFFQECPLFFISLQHYWDKLSVIVSCMSEDSDALGFSELETLHRWMSSFFSGSSVSIPDLMYYPPWIIASCLDLRLKISKNAVNFYHRLQNMMEVESFKKLCKKLYSDEGLTSETSISVCLFACILSQCSEMVLHENEISENSQVWTTSMELLKSCPEVLFCFMEDDKSHIYSHDLQQLRTLLLPNKYSKLLPIVFFSLLTKCKRDIVEKVKQFPHFKQITITMNQKFTQLRKTCLENDAYKSCEKPFQLEFAKEVFQFLRHHTGS